MNVHGLKKIACTAIDEDGLFYLSQKIWSNPELGFQERFAHDVFTQFLSKKGFEVSLLSFIKELG